MPKKSTKIATRQKSGRTLQGRDPSEGNLGKRPVKTPRVDAKQRKWSDNRLGAGK